VKSISFNGAMIRAILDGRKTQTRRRVKVQWCQSAEALMRQAQFDPAYKCPYGVAKDRLWVSETWRVRGGREYEYQQHQPSCVYRSDVDAVGYLCNEWRPSIHMPRWASRITLEITGIRVERLQDITEEDAKKEGVTITEYYAMSRHPHRSAFIDLWDSIYSNWDANPWVWVVEFRRAQP